MLTTVDFEQTRETLGLPDRIASVPADAAVRGVWFSMHSKYVSRLGKGESEALKSAVQKRARIPFRMYPLTEYLEELAVAAAIVDPTDPAQGLRNIWRGAAPTYLATPFGRSLLSLLGLEPGRYMRWLSTHRDHFCTYGTWWLEEHGPGYVTMEIVDEYIWIESAHRGGAEGVLRTFGVEGSVEPELVSPYSGRLHIRWSVPVH